MRKEYTSVAEDKLRPFKPAFYQRVMFAIDILCDHFDEGSGAFNISAVQLGSLMRLDEAKLCRFLKRMEELDLIRRGYPGEGGMHHRARPMKAPAWLMERIGGDRPSRSMHEAQLSLAV